MPPRTPFNELFCTDTNGCWIWRLGRDNWGYGHVERDGYAGHAHRWMWMTQRGPIADRLEVDHLCHVRVCVNPNHMELVTRRTNMHRSDGPIGRNARKTHCQNGHPFDERNTYYGKPLSVTGGRPRRCRVCHAAWERAKRKSQAAVLRAEAAA